MKLNVAIKKVEKFLNKNIANKCYIASEAIYHLAGGKQAGLKPVNLKHEGASHWYLETNSGRIVDVTVGQFKTTPDYSQGRGRGFLTKGPCKRTQKLLAHIA